MHRVFGERKQESYMDRKGAYIIPVKNSKIAVVQTTKGLFLLGGGIQATESDTECIQRECLEEIGYAVQVGELLCSAETYTEHPKIGAFHPIQTYYSGKLLEKKKEPDEKDHTLVWLDYREVRGNLFAEMQNWALEQFLEKYCCNR